MELRLFPINFIVDYFYIIISEIGSSPLQCHFLRLFPVSLSGLFLMIVPPLSWGFLSLYFSQLLSFWLAFPIEIPPSIRHRFFLSILAKNASNHSHSIRLVQGF
jgi:hypothetical protein